MYHPSALGTLVCQSLSVAALESSLKRGRNQVEEAADLEGHDFNNSVSPRDGDIISVGVIFESY